MRKLKTVVVALVLALVMAVPVTVMASTPDETLFRIEDGTVYVQLRPLLYSFGFTVEWDAQRRAAVVPLSATDSFVIPVEELGGFIEDGVSWISYELANSIIGLLLSDLAVQPVERIDLTLWEPERFSDVREPMFSTDLPPGAIAVGYIQYMSDNLGARSAFTYRELEAAVWIVEELLAMGHDWDNIAVQEFTYWDAVDMELGLFGPLNWWMVTSPMILGVGRDYQLREDRVSQNVVLTIPGQSERTIIVGAHYDSPPYASASDNASGTALLMESAQRMMELENYYTIVYVFFGAEEVGLIGAYYYIESLTARERDNIVMMVNADVLIEGPYILYGAAAMPVLTDALLDEIRADLLYDLMDLIIMEYEWIVANAEYTMANDPTVVVDLEFDSLEGFIELIAFNIATMPIDALLLNASFQGLVEPAVDAVAGQVSAIAAELTASHDFELISFPELAVFPTDSLAFFFEGFTVVNFVGMERMENMTPELAAQLTRLGEGVGDFTVTILHTPLDEFHFIEYTWPGMMDANLEAFVLFLEAILLGSFS